MGEERGHVRGGPCPPRTTLSVVTRGLDPRAYGKFHFCMGGWVYILASKPFGTLYIGVTSDLVQRVWQHRAGIVPGFTKKYGVRTLVWFEEHGGIESAIQREHTMKHWKRRWKTDLVIATNPEWRDLWEDINQPV